MILPIIHSPHLPRQPLRSNTRKHPTIPPILLFWRFLPQSVINQEGGGGYRDVECPFCDLFGRCVWLGFSFFDHEVSDICQDVSIFGRFTFSTHTIVIF